MITKIISYILIIPIRIYKLLISPLLGRNCRHYPTCSIYSIEALKKFGAFWGLLLSIGRVLRCNPWGTSGYDPLPPTNISKKELWKFIKSFRKYEDQSTKEFDDYDISQFYDKNE